MDKENQKPNLGYFEDSESDMPDLTSSSETSDQVDDEPYLVLSDNPGEQYYRYRSSFPAPHVCFCNTYFLFGAWLDWLLGFNNGPLIEELGSVHRHHAYDVQPLPTVTVVESSDSDSDWSIVCCVQVKVCLKVWQSYHKYCTVINLKNIPLVWLAIKIIEMLAVI